MISEMYFDKFVAHLTENKWEKSPANLYAPINYILELGGKRIRPVVTLAACHLFKDKYENALNAALAVEVFHNFSLVHDDIMDEADIRRGQPTVHKKYSVNQAILSGDLMQIHAYQIICKYDEPIKSALLSIFTDAAIKVCEGQQWDMEFEERDDVQIPEYIKMIEYKTAALLAASLQMGASVGQASTLDVDRMGAYGTNIGIAFQIQDDYLDAFGSKAAVGKKIGGDIQQNKKTILYLKAIELANPAQRARLIELFGQTPADSAAKIEEVKSIFNELGIPQIAKKLIKSYTDEALAALQSVDVDEAKKQFLYELTALLMGRKS